MVVEESSESASRSDEVGDEDASSRCFETSRRALFLMGVGDCRGEFFNDEDGDENDKCEETTKGAVDADDLAVLASTFRLDRSPPIVDSSSSFSVSKFMTSSKAS